MGDFAACTSKCIDELREAMKRQGWAGKTTLTDTEKVYVAIAYNRGHANPTLGFKQDFQSDDGRYYGENIFEYLQMAQSISVSGAAPREKTKTTRDVYEVVVQTSPLRLRSSPKIDKDNAEANVMARLPNGQQVERVAGDPTAEFLEIETTLNRELYHGFAATKYLRLVSAAAKPKKRARKKPA